MSKLKVGQVWRTRGGDEVSILYKDEDDMAMPFIGDNGSNYTSEGGFYFDNDESDFDLVELIKDVESVEDVDVSIADLDTDKIDTLDKYYEVTFAGKKVRTPMGMLDHFAIAAMRSGQCPCNHHNHQARAEWYYNEAKAMLEERKKHETSN